MMKGSRKSPRNTSPVNNSAATNTTSQPIPSYPLPAYVDFVPGGVDYGIGNGNGNKDTSSDQNDNWHTLNYLAPDALVQKAFAADDTLHKYALRYQAQADADADADSNSDAKKNINDDDDEKKMPYRLPSLSVLAEATFAPLTGVHASSVRKWADAMVVAYCNESDADGDSDTDAYDEILTKSEADLIAEFKSTNQNIPTPSPTKNSAPSSPKHANELVNLLKSLHREYRTKSLSPENAGNGNMCIPVRPCGYVFRSGDIAWNCRTCQYDNTCVLCDTCFQQSDHEGHDVTFHKTSPGGCCDCGDLEAWKIGGCCPLHRPKEDTKSEIVDPNDMDVGNQDDVGIGANASGALNGSLEAFKASLKSRVDGETYVKEMLPEKLAAALGVVIGAAVQTVLQAVDGSSIGADPVQWTRRWADQIRRIHDGRSVDEEYVLSAKRSSAATVGDAMTLACPNRFRLHLRLHNDDVHTYDEVIDSLWGRGRSFNRPTLRPEDSFDERDAAMGLVKDKNSATEKTGKVDADGQVIVRDYNTMKGAMAGFDRLKAHGLHSSVVSTPQIELENRARMLISWLADIAEAHPAVSALVIHALVDVTEGSDAFGNTFVWGDAKMIPSWSFSEGHLSSARVSINEDEDDLYSIPGWRRRLDVFPPNLESSFLTREESRQLHKLGFVSQHDLSSPSKGVDLDFYSRVPYILQSERYRKSPHSLWGVMPSPFAKSKKYFHPVLSRDNSTAPKSHHLVDSLIVLDTDLRKQQEAEMLTKNAYTHKLLGLHMISGVGLVDVDGDENGGSTMKPTAEDWRQLLSISSYRAPISPLLLLLLLDPYPTKQVRVSIHQLFLSLMVDSRLKARFAASLGGIAYRPLTTLFCAGIGTEADTPLHFTVQIFTAPSIVRALCDSNATQKLLITDANDEVDDGTGGRGVFCLPLAHNIARCIHTNLLGACEEVRMVLKNTDAGQISNGSSGSSPTLKALVYQQGEQPLNTLLPSAPDDGFLDCRSTKHKRLPHLLRDLEYVLETPGTAMHLLCPDHDDDSVNHTMDFATIWCRLLRLAQGMDPQKRKINGGHVEFEKLRWLEAFSLSLHFAGARDKLAESVPSGASSISPPVELMREAMGNLFSASLREMKWWLYREGALVALPPTTSHMSLNADKMDALQRSTLHVSTSSLGVASIPPEDGSKTPALSCAPNIKMTENNLEVIENAISIEQSQHRLSGSGRGTIAGDWLRVPHSPHAGDCLSFHLPLHRSLARNVLATCSFVISEELRDAEPFWWQLPALDDDLFGASGNATESVDHPMCTLLKPTLRSLNCRITWSDGPECNSEEAHKRRSRSKAISSSVAAAKVIHSLCDHPLRCLAAAEQIKRHLWARNGSSAAGMALNYGTTPLCRSFRDLDLTMVQLSASGFSIGLGARRVFNLLLSRFSLENFLCDLERKAGNKSPTSATKGSGSIDWVVKKRLQDPEHAEVLMEALFATICILVTELPPPPPVSASDTTGMKTSVRRELLHALATSPLTYSKAMDAASTSLSRRDEAPASGSLDTSTASFRTVFESVLQETSEQKSQGSRGAPKYALKYNVSDEYDPSFYHLKGSEHQQAMENIARLRRQKSNKIGKGCCLPIVCAPSLAHPRFMPCRLILHLPSLDAAIRRALMFALTGGKWVPPSAPSEIEDDIITLSSPSFASDFSGSDGKTIKLRVNPHRRARLEEERKKEFSDKTVKNASHSFLEVLQLLTLQVHTLEECAYMHRSHPNLDHENKSLSSSVSINSYLGRLVHVPSSLLDVWAFRCAPDGPLNSKGSGLNKASILGLLIALYEHRSDNGANSNSDSGQGDEENGGARFLVANGLKWILRFVSALVAGAESVSQAYKSATDGVPLRHGKSQDTAKKHSTSWTIDEHLQSSVRGMLNNLPDLWPTESSIATKGQDKLSEKAREARKAAQMRVIERMKKQQASFAASMAADDKTNFAGPTNANEEADLCIICRCDDEDGENNGPLGYLGHVQRSRSLQLRCHTECLSDENKISKAYRVVGDKGCQVRKHESLDSAPVACIPAGSIVHAEDTVVSTKYDLQTRRIFIKYTSQNNKVIEGWASVQSTQGYVILSPVLNLCYKSSRWGATRPLIRQCGHAAHLSCVDTHLASIHQKAQTETPYDGRYAADIEDGEFLCPLCKQLCNVVVPAGSLPTPTCKDEDMTGSTSTTVIPKKSLQEQLGSLHDSLKSRSCTEAKGNEAKRAIKQYGNYLEHSMQVFSWDPHQDRKRKVQEKWHKSIKKWDFIENEDDDYFDRQEGKEDPYISDILRLLRQQHIAWAAAGHTAAASEASARGIKKSGFEPPTSDPWIDYESSSRDSHSMAVELRRTLTAAASLQNILCDEINSKLERDECKTDNAGNSIVGHLLGNILKGQFWTDSTENGQAGHNHWNILTSLLSSLPCHVSKDETLSLKQEARATAAQSWVVNGSGSESQSSGGEVTKMLPPAPISVRKIPEYDNLKKGWGSMHPSDSSNNDLIPFRPALATGFLYIPLLSWDLTSFSGAIFSTLLSSKNVKYDDFIDAARILMVARMVQYLVTLRDFERTSDSGKSTFEAKVDIPKESSSIGILLDCLNLQIKPEMNTLPRDNDADQILLALVSCSILPFARSLILLLRASLSALRLRKSEDSSGALDEFLENEDTMYIEDGFFFMQALGCPMPSEILESSDETSSQNWMHFINRWICAVQTIDTYQGSHGDHIIYHTEEWHPITMERTGTGKTDYASVNDEDSIDEHGVESASAHPYEMDVSARSFQDDEDATDEEMMNPNDDEPEDADEDFMPGFGMMGGVNILDADDSSDEEMEHVDDAFEDINDFPPFLDSLPTQSGDLTGESIDSDASQYSWDDLDDSFDSDSRTKKLDDLYANVSSSAIIPFQSSFLGIKEPGPGPRGGSLDYATAASLMSDASHLGLIHRPVSASQGAGLIRLPRSFVELYSLVNKLRAVGGRSSMDEEDEGGPGETAICLVTGATIRSGSQRRYRSGQRSVRAPGACTLHARKVGSGTGIFFLPQKCTVLLVHNKKSAYWASLYVDENGEEDPNLHRGRPLFLMEERYEALATLWRQHGIPGEVAQIRSTSDRVIRDNWY